jgi:hypothetical protein
MLYRIHLDTGGFRIRNFTITTTAAHFGCEIKMYLSNIRNFYVICTQFFVMFMNFLFLLLYVPHVYYHNPVLSLLKTDRRIIYESSITGVTSGARTAHLSLHMSALRVFRGWSLCCSIFSLLRSVL